MEAVRPIGSDWKVRGIGDFDRDGKTDILLQDEVSGWTLIWFMNGAEVVSGGAIRPVSTNWRVDMVGDLDGDGRADIVWRDESAVSPTFGWLISWIMEGAEVIDTGVPGLVPDTDWQVAK